MGGGRNSCFWSTPILDLFVEKCWKRLKGKNPEGKNFRKLLRRKQSSAKISKISRNTLKSSKGDFFYLLRNLLKYLLRTFFSSAKFSEDFTLCVFTLWLFPKMLYFPKVLTKNRGASKTAVPTTTHPIPHLTPSDMDRPKHILNRSEQSGTLLFLLNFYVFLGFRGFCARGRDPTWCFLP